jgi:hypothetical protein
LLSALEESLQTKSTTITNTGSLTTPVARSMVSSNVPPQRNTALTTVRIEHVLPPGTQAAIGTQESSLPGTNVTNAALVPSAPSVAKATGNEPNPVAETGWPVNLAQTLAQLNRRSLWLFLLLLLMAITAGQILRRRARKKKAEAFEQREH